MAAQKLSANTIFYSEPQVDAGLTYIQRLRQQIDILGLRAEAASELIATLDEANTQLDTDGTLGASLAASGNVVLGMQFVPGEPLGNPDEELPDYLTRLAIPDGNVSDPSGEFFTADPNRQRDSTD